MSRPITQLSSILESIQQHEGRDKWLAPNPWRRLWPLRVWVRTDRFPWHPKRSSALLDLDSKRRVGERWGWSLRHGGMGRFGGGWAVKLGVAVGGNGAVMIDLLVGTLHLRFSPPDTPTR